MRLSSLLHPEIMAEDARIVDNPRLRFIPKMSDKFRLILIAVIIGCIVGLGAAFLKWSIPSIIKLLGLDLNADTPHWNLLWLPVVGILLTGIYQRYILRDHISHGIDRLVNDLAEQKYYLNPKLTYAPLIASSITLGFGGSAGSEGPIAYAGAAIGSNVGRICGVSSDTVYLLIAIGAGAGIAGIFKAPVGGAIFTLEVLGMAMTTVSVIALFAATIASALTVYALTDFTLDLPWTENINFDPSILLWTVGLGVFCGLYSIYYSHVMMRMRKVYKSISNPWLMNLASGSVLAILLFLFPSLYSEGYNIIGKVINLDWSAPAEGSIFGGISLGMWTLPVILLGIMLAKCFACSAANSGGGVAGDFAPTLFAGAIVGLFFALCINNLFEIGLKPQVFAFIGMAGVMAGVIRAPLLALFLTMEMCNAFDYIFPLVVVSMISYGMVMLATGRRFYRITHIHPHNHQ